MEIVLLKALILLSFSLPAFARYSPFLPSTSPIFISAAQTLTKSNHLSMSLTLQLVSDSLLSTSKSCTIFAPLDSSFVSSGQPSLSLLKSHISPIRIPINELKAFPQGTTLPTLSSVSKLVVTSTFLEGNLTINNVKVDDFAVYDDGSLVIYEIGEFFHSSSLYFPFFAPRISQPSSYRGPQLPGLPGLNPVSPFVVAIGLLSSREYKKMASFLDMQLGVKGFGGKKLTIFAPDDEAVEGYGVNLGNYSSFFRAHVVPGLFKWMDLMMMKDETVLESFAEEGFKINVRKSGDIIVINGAALIFADLYCSDWLVVHGLNDAILPLRTQGMKQSIKDSSSQFGYDVKFEADHFDNVDSHEGTGRRLKQSVKRDSGLPDYTHADYDVEFEENPIDYDYLDDPSLID